MDGERQRSRFDAVAEEVAESTPSWKVEYGRDFERRMLRVLFADQEFATTAGAHLDHRLFSTPSLRWMAQKLVGYVREHGVTIAKDALRIELDRDLKLGRLTKSNRDACKALVDTVDNSVKDRSYVKEELFRFIKNQVTDRAVRACLDHLDSQDFDSVDKELLKVLDVQAALDGGLGHFFHRDRKKRKDRRKEYTPDGVSTGLFLDQKLKSQGMPPKSILTVVAPSNAGKSSTLVYIGKSAAVSGDAQKVLYITTELSEDAVCDKFDACFTATSINMLEKERNAVSRQVRDLGRKRGEFLVVKEFPPGVLTPSGLRAYIRQLERVSFYPTMIIVDSADDMVPDVKTRDNDAYEDYGQVWRGLRKISYEVRAPVVTASQTQRGALNKEHLDWDFVADSAKKIMVSDVVIILQQTREENKNKTGRFFVAKNRLGPAKWEWKVRLDWAKNDIRTIG